MTSIKITTKNKPSKKNQTNKQKNKQKKTPKKPVLDIIGSPGNEFNTVAVSNAKYHSL